MVKGCQHCIFLGNGPLASESVPVFKFQLRPGPLVPWMGGGEDETLVLDAADGQSSHLCVFSGCTTCGLVCCLLRTTQYLLKQEGPILSWFWGYKMLNQTFILRINLTCSWYKVLLYLDLFCLLVFKKILSTVFNEGYWSTILFSYAI